MKPRWGATALSALLAVLASIGGLTLAPPATAAAAQPPNIVVLMVDDLAVMDDRLLTVLPNIKSTFLQHGLRFTDYVGNNPLCCPGRSNFLSGQYSRHHGVIVNDARLFDPSETIATELQGVGYQTYIVGKYLNRTNILDNKMPPGWTKAFLTNGQYWRGWYWLNGKRMQFPEDTYSTDISTQYATRWIDQANPQHPLFMMLTPSAPHGGADEDGARFVLQPSPPDRYLHDPRCESLNPWKPPNYGEADISDKPAYISNFHNTFPNGWPLERTCGAMLAVDDELGRVREAMAAAGRTNTLYLFTSDNGMTFGAHRYDAKSVPYATPMPLFARWDSGGAGSAPRTVSNTLSNVDVAPTLCALAGCQMGPYANGFGADGLSFAPLLRGHALTMGRDVVLEESPGKVDPHIPRWSGVRTTNENHLGHWVYTEYDTGECELYNLTADPWELENRCNKDGYQDVQSELADDLRTLRLDAPGPPCTTICYVDAYNGNDAYGGASSRHAKQHIQTAIDAVNPGGVIRVMPGHYRERARNRTPADRSGSYDFGLFVPASKSGISIIGVDPVETPITDSALTQADITTIGDADFGPVGIYVDAPDTTFQGLTINGNLDPDSMSEDDGETFEVSANGFALRNSVTNVPGGGSIWFEDPQNHAISVYHVIKNDFRDGTTIHVPGPGSAGTVANREIRGNTFDLGGSTQPAIDFGGAGSTVGGAWIVNNTFSDGRAYIRSRGTVVDAQFDWIAWFSNNAFDGAVIEGPNPQGNDLTAYSSTCGLSSACPTREIGATIQRQLDHAQAGDTVYVKAGTYSESPSITTSVTLKSATGRDATTIELGTGPTELGALSIDAPNVTVDGFTIAGKDGTPSHSANTNILVAADLDTVTIQNNRLLIGAINDATDTGEDGIGILTANTTAPGQFVATLKIKNNIFRPRNGSAFRAWHVRPGVTDLTVTSNTVTGAFDATALVQATAAVVSYNTIVGSGSSASIGASGLPDPDLYGQTTFQGNDISGTSAEIVATEANNITITNNVIHDVGNGVVLNDPDDRPELDSSTVHVNENSISGASGKLLLNGYPAAIDASGNWWGTNDETDITDALGPGDVDITPFLDVGSDVGGSPGFQGNHAIVHATALRSQTTSASRLVEAVGLVDPSGTVLVGPGSFGGNISIAKSVSLEGAHFGDSVSGRSATDASESLITGTVTLTAPDIIVDGFSISDTSSDEAYGVVVQSGASGATISHNIVDGVTSTGPGVDATGQGISLKNGPDGVTITNNRIANVSGAGPADGIVVGDGSADDAEAWIWNNTISNISGSVAHAIAFDGPASVADVRRNVITNLTALAPGDAVAVWFGNDDALDGAIVRRNSLDVGPNGYGIDVGIASLGSVDGACNWWGDPSGPSPTGTGSRVDSNVDADPWLGSSDLGGSCLAIEVGSAAPDVVGNEGQTLTTVGSFVSTSALPPAISANHPFGTFTDNHDGTWSWSYFATDNIPPVTITVRATDANGSRATDRFVARAVNVPPTATFTAPTSVLYGSAFHPALTEAADPSSVDTSAGLTFAFDCGDGDGFSNPGSSPTANCVAPDDPGDITVQGRVIDKDGGQRTYSRTVHVTQPAISLTPAATAFGTVATGSGQRTRTFTVTNVGTAPLAVQDSSLSGANAGAFSITNDGCSGVHVAINQSCTISVTFAPTADGQKTASLVVDSDDPHLPSASSSLTGTGAELGIIRIRLMTRGGNTKSPFTFTATGGIKPFQLPKNGAVMRQFETAAPATYTITQTNSTSWPLIRLTCTTPQTIRVAQRSVTIQLAVGQTVDCTFVNSHRAADGMIATTQNGPFAGSNVYSPVPDDRQRAAQVVPRGTVKSFWVVLQNDSQDTDSFGVSAKYAGSSLFRVKIWRANLNITAKVLAGAYTLQDLAPKGLVKLRIEVKAAADVPLTATGNVRVFMRSKSGPDAIDVVEANVSAQ